MFTDVYKNKKINKLLSVRTLNITMAVKIILTILLFSLISRECHSSTDVNAIIQRALANDEGCQSETSVGCKDCRTLRLCYKDKETSDMKEVIKSCEDKDRTMPYCSKGKCTNDSSVCDYNPKEALYCVEDGIQMDPLDCRSFYTCYDNEDGTFSGHVYNCPKNEYYNHKEQYCEGSQECIEYTEDSLCMKMAGKLVPYPTNGSYYGRCAPKMNHPYIKLFPNFYKCSIDYEFNAKEEECEPVCKTRGQKIHNNRDSGKYYDCVLKPQGLVPEPRVCGGALQFDDKTKRCAMPKTSTTTGVPV